MSAARKRDNSVPPVAAATTPGHTATKTSSALFPSTATKLDILVLRQLLLKRTCTSSVTGGGGNSPQHSTAAPAGGIAAFLSSEVARRLDQTITTETLLDLLRPSDTVTDTPTCLACIPLRPMFEASNPLAADLAFVIQRLSKAFSPSDANHGHTTSFLCVLNASTEDTPMMSPESLAKLSRLATLPFVTQGAVREVLKEETFGVMPSHPQYDAIHDIKVQQILGCIFYTRQGEEQATWTTSDVLMDVINTVQSKALERRRFGSSVASYQIEARRSVSSLLFYLAMLIVVIGAVLNLGIWRLYIVGNATSPDFPWTNYCEDGPESTCYFSSRSLTTITTHAQVLRYVRQELVLSLWGSVPNASTAASQVPFGDAWFLGALLVRVAPAEHASGGARFSCDDLNLTIAFGLSTTNEVFTCGANHYTSVPFSFTQAEALSALSTFNVDAPSEDTAVVVTYSLYNPPTGAVILNEAAMTLKQAGGVVVRARHYLASTRLRTAVLVCYIAYSLFFFLEHALVLVSSLRGFPSQSTYFIMFVKVLNYYCINIAWSNLASSDSVDHWPQASFEAHHLDTIAYRDSVVQYAFGVWILVVVALSATYLSHVQVVRLVVQLVQEAMAPLIATTIVFLCCFIAFVDLSMFIFGPSQVEFASFTYAFRVMFPFLVGVGDSSVFTAEMYIVGNAFYIVFAVLTNFVALNIFNGVMMAPLGDLISSSGALWGQLRHSVLQRAKRRRQTWRQRRQLAFRLALLPWLNFLFDALPVPDTRWSVLHRFLNPNSNYHYLVNASKQLYDMHDWVEAQQASALVAQPVADRNGLASPMDWRRNSLLVQSLRRDHQCFGITDTSMTLVMLIVQYESRWFIFRDARLAKIVALWEEDQAVLQRDFASVDGWEGSFATIEEPDDNIDASALNAQQVSNAAPTTPTTTAAKQENVMVIHNTVDLRADSDDDDDDDITLSAPAIELNALAPRSITQLAQEQADALEHVTFAFVDAVKCRLLCSYVASPVMSLVVRGAHVFMVVFAYVFLLVVCSTWSVDTAYCTADLHAGLRDATYRQYCDDAACASASTYATSFAQGGQFSDLQGFMGRVLDPQIFSLIPPPSPNNASLAYLANESLPIDGIDTSPVRWSSAVRFHSLTIRQLRGARGGCQLPFGPPPGMSVEESARFAMFASLECFSGSEFETAPLPVPADSPLDASAYVYQEGCPDAWKHTTYGYDYSYPCAGYATAINSTETLLYASDTWLNDPSVRLVVLSMQFYHNTSGAGPVLHITYDMYVQVGMGQGQAVFWVTTSQENTETLSIARQTVILMHAHGNVVLASLLYFTVLYRGSVAKAYGAVQSQMPIFSILCTAIAVVVYYAELPSVGWSSAITCCVATVLFAVKFISVVVIPVTGLISRRATSFSRMSGYILGRVLVVLPFFVIFIAAFGFSGYVLWGTTLQQYATLNQSFNTVVLGLIGGWDFASINAVFPGLAILFTSVFFVIIPVILLPTLLSLIVQSAEDANNELAVTNEVVALAERMEAWVYFGPLASLALSLWVAGHDLAAQPHQSPFRRRISRWWLRAVTKLMGARRVSTNKRHNGKWASSGNHDDDRMEMLHQAFDGGLEKEDDAAALLERQQQLRMYEAWRLPSAVDCLQPYMGAPRIMQLLQFVRFHKLCPTMQFTAIAFIIAEMAVFRRKEQAIHDAEAAMERQLMRDLASASMAVLQRSETLGGGPRV